MSIAYYVLTDFDLLKEITKWHILQYIHFPDIFLNKFCNDTIIDKVKWLFESKYVNINLLNNFVKNIFAQDYYAFPPNAFGNPIGNPIESTIQVNSFMEYILLYKSCPEIVEYVLNKYPNEKKLLIDSKLLEKKEVQIYLQNNLPIHNLLCNILNIMPGKVIKDNTENLLGTKFVEKIPIEECIRTYRVAREAMYSLNRTPKNDSVYCDTCNNSQTYNIISEYKEFAIMNYGDTDHLKSPYELKYYISDFKTFIEDQPKPYFIN